MTEANPDGVTPVDTWRRATFFLIVTGEGERESLPELFRRFCYWSHGLATFQVLRRIGQYRPKKSSRHIELGTLIPIPDKITEAWLHSRKHLASDDSFVLLVDDLEWNDRNDIQHIFELYRPRQELFGPLSAENRVGVFFLRMMLEAYYWSDLRSVEEILGTPRSRPCIDGDPEEIRHPKTQLKAHWPTFKEREHAGPILKRLNVDQVLGDPSTCASLRTIYAWCSRAMGFRDSDRFRLQDGRRCPVTSPQIDRFPAAWRDGQPRSTKSSQ